MKRNTKTSTCVMLAIAMSLGGFGRALGDCPDLAGTHLGEYRERQVTIGTIIAEIEGSPGGMFALVTFEEFGVTFGINGSDAPGRVFGCALFPDTRSQPTSQGDSLRIFSVRTGGSGSGAGISGSWILASGRSGTWFFLIDLQPDPDDEDDEDDEDDPQDPRDPPDDGGGGGGCPTVTTVPESKVTGFLDTDLWIDGAVPGPDERALVENGPHVVSFESDVTNAALFAKDSPHTFLLQGFTYRLTEPANCVPSFKVSAAENFPITFSSGTISAEEIELAGPTVLDQNVLVGTVAQIGVAGGPKASLELINSAAFSAVEIVVGSEAEGEISVADGSRVEIVNALGLLTIGREALGALSVDPGGRVDLGPSDVDLVIAEFSEASGSHLDVAGGELIQRGTDESRPGKTIIGKGPGAKGTLSVLIGGKASLGDVTLGDKPGAEGTLSVLVEAELEAADITIGAQGRGTLEVGGSSKVLAAFMFLGAEPDAEGTLTLAQESELTAVEITIGAKGRGTLEISDSSTVEVLNALLMGTEARGTLLIESGARLEVADVSSVAFGDDGEATARVVGKSSLWKTGVLLVGPNGVLAIKNEGSVESTDAQLTGNFDDFASVDVIEGSKWSVSGTLRVGDNEVEGALDVEKSSFLLVTNESFLTCDTVVIGQHGLANVKGVLIRDPGTFSFGTEKGLLRAQAASEPVPGLTTRRLIIKEGGELIADTITLGPGGELSGAGAANLDIISEGTIDPGGEEDETAEFTINGDLTLEGDSEVQVDIGGLVPGEEFDVLIVNGHCQLGGRLKINLVNDFTPEAGDRFEVLKYESREGEYDTIDSAGTGVFFTPELANGRLTLIVAVVDESGRLSPEELADLAQLQNACGPGCGPMGLMPLSLTLLGICGIRAGVSRRPSGKNARRPLR